MKKELLIGVLGFIIIIVGIGYIRTSYYSGATKTQTNIALTNTEVQQALNKAAASGATTLSAEVIGQHATSSDCWLLIDNGVYDVTSYLRLHPGGRAIIIPYCGKDATAAFTTKAGQGSHSSFAQSQLAAYAIGTLGTTITVENIQTTQQEINTLPVPTSSSDSEHEDEEYEQEEYEND